MVIVSRGRRRSFVVPTTCLLLGRHGDCLVVVGSWWGSKQPASTFFGLDPKASKTQSLAQSSITCSRELQMQDARRHPTSPMLDETMVGDLSRRQGHPSSNHTSSTLDADPQPPSVSRLQCLQASFPRCLILSRCLPGTHSDDLEVSHAARHRSEPHSFIPSSIGPPLRLPHAITHRQCSAHSLRTRIH
jgi:hypothetical protein